MKSIRGSTILHEIIVIVTSERSVSYDYGCVNICIHILHSVCGYFPKPVGCCSYFVLSSRLAVTNLRVYNPCFVRSVLNRCLDFLPVRIPENEKNVIKFNVIWLRTERDLIYNTFPTISRPAAASFRVCRPNFFIIIGDVLFRIIRNGASLFRPVPFAKRCSRVFAVRCFEVICETTFMLPRCTSFASGQTSSRWKKFNEIRLKSSGL